MGPGSVPLSGSSWLFGSTEARAAPPRSLPERPGSEDVCKDRGRACAWIRMNTLFSPLGVDHAGAHEKAAIPPQPPTGEWACASMGEARQKGANSSWAQALPCAAGHGQPHAHACVYASVTRSLNPVDIWLRRMLTGESRRWTQLTWTRMKPHESNQKGSPAAVTPRWPLQQSPATHLPLCQAIKRAEQLAGSSPKLAAAAAAASCVWHIKHASCMPMPQLHVHVPRGWDRLSGKVFDGTDNICCLLTAIPCEQQRTSRGSIVSARLNCSSQDQRGYTFHQHLH